MPRHWVGQLRKEKRPRPLYGAALHSICCPLVAIVNVVRKNRLVLHLHCGNARHCLGHVVSPQWANFELCDN